jgi:hypothetical protein
MSKTLEQQINGAIKMSWDHEYAENGIISRADAIELCKAYASECVKASKIELISKLDEGELRFAVDQCAQSLYGQNYHELVTDLEKKIRASELAIVLIDELRRFKL